MNLWDIPATHINDPPSSYQAAEVVNLKGWHRRIYEVLKDHDRPKGYTAKELAFIMDEDDNGMYFKVSKRLRELFNKGKIVNCRPRRSLINPINNKHGEPIAEQTWRVR